MNAERSGTNDDLRETALILIGIIRKLIAEIRRLDLALKEAGIDLPVKE